MRFGAYLTIRLRLTVTVGCLAVVALGVAGPLAWEARPANASPVVLLSGNRASAALLDANQHLRRAVYYDTALTAATNELNQVSINADRLTRRFRLGDATHRRAIPATYDPSRQSSAILA